MQVPGLCFSLLFKSLVVRLNLVLFNKCYSSFSSPISDCLFVHISQPYCVAPCTDACKQISIAYTTCIPIVAASAHYTERA